MKTGILFFLTLLSFSVYADELNFSSYSDSYSLGEVFQGYVKFNEMPLNNFEAGNVKVVVNGEEIREGIYFYKIKDKEYFFYFDLDLAGEYVVKLVNLQYRNDSKFVVIEKEIKFLVNENEYSLNVKPAFLLNNKEIKFNFFNNKGDVFVSFEVPEYVNNVYKEELVASEREREFQFNADSDKLKKYVTAPDPQNNC